MPEEKKVEEIKEEKQNLEVDPYVKRLLESTGKSIEQILAPTVDEKKQEVEEKPKVDAEAEAKAKAEADAALAEKAKAEKEAADKEAALKQEAAQPVRPVVLQKKESPEEKKKLEEDEAAKKARESDEVYIASLTPEQQDEIELARFAESSGKKPGAVAKILDYCRKLDKFIDEHPEVTADSEEFIKFKEDHEPKMTAIERRKLEREMISTQAVAKATEETRKEFEPVVRELNEIKTAPVIKSVINEVEATMVKPNAEALAIDVETFQKVRAMPYAQAIEEYPVEAPIIVGTLAAAQEWTKIWNSVIPIDDRNPTHRWLMDFVAAKEVEMLKKPAAETTRDGRQFMPLGKFVNLQRSNPELAKGYYSFDQGSVVDLISRNGVEQYNQQIKKLERSGFKRAVEKKSETPEVKAGEKTEAASPKATGHTMVGAGDEAAKAAQMTMPAHLRNVVSAFNGGK